MQYLENLVTNLLDAVGDDFRLSGDEHNPIGGVRAALAEDLDLRTGALKLNNQIMSNTYGRAMLTCGKDLTSRSSLIL